MAEKYLDKEKYVKAVVKKVKCTSSKKKEIEKQLLSDISIALEAGESLEDVLENMGSVSEVAGEFNSNLSEEEMKKAKVQKRNKMVSVIATFLVVLLSFVYWIFPKTMEFGVSGVFDEQEVRTRIEETILLVNENNFEALLEISNDEMVYVFNKDTITNLRKMIHEDWGEFKEFGNIYLAEVKQRGKYFVIGQITVNYENVMVIYTITLDEELKLAGLYVR